MIVKERLQELIKNNFYVNHKALGNIQMQESLDYIRIYDKNKKYDAIQIIDISEDITSKVDKELSNQYLIKEEVWMLGSDIALDLYI